MNSTGSLEMILCHTTDTRFFLVPSILFVKTATIQFRDLDHPAETKPHPKSPFQLPSLIVAIVECEARIFRGREQRLTQLTTSIIDIGVWHSVDEGLSVSDHGSRTC